MVIPSADTSTFLAETEFDKAFDCNSLVLLPEIRTALQEHPIHIMGTRVSRAKTGGRPSSEKKEAPNQEPATRRSLVMDAQIGPCKCQDISSPADRHCSVNPIVIVSCT
jgi:hypothetical protein